MNISHLPRYPHTFYHYIIDGSTLRTAISQLQRTNPAELGVDIETTGLDPFIDRIRLVQIAIQNYPVLVIDLFAIPQEQWEPLRQLLQSSILKVGHGLKFERKFLLTAGLGFNGPFFDTELAFRVWLSGRRVKASLQSTVAYLLNQFLDKQEQKSDFSRPQLTQKQIQYGADDAIAPLHLKPKLIEYLHEEGEQLYQIAKDYEFPTIEATAALELNGMKFDHRRWLAFSQEIELKCDQAKAIIMQVQRKDRSQLSFLPQLTETINPNSSQQVVPALQLLGVPVTSMSERALAPYAKQYPVVQALLDYHRLSKFTSTLGQKLPQFIHPQTRRIHGNWFQIGTKSGRYSCKEPPLQTIPRTDIARKCFVAESGWKIIKADYSQIELRILAKVCGDKPLIKAFRNHQDVHALTAALIFNKPASQITPEERAIGKIINFGIIYGMGPTKLMQEIESSAAYPITLSAAKLFIANFYQGHPQIKAWQAKIRRQVVHTHGDRSYTLAGRRRIWQWTDKPPINQMINHPIQGSNADIIKLALHRLNQALEQNNHQARIIAVLHDEIVVECPDEELRPVADLMNRIMVAAAATWLNPIPIVVDIKIADTWGGDLHQTLAA